jgi:hypothetical protein
MNGYRGISTGVLQCAHSVTRTELDPPGSEHYGRLRCAECGAFLRFVPKPKNVERRQLNAYRLAKLQMAPGLNKWERQFIDSLAKLGSNKLSPKQQSMFDRLCLTHLDGRRAV